MLDPSRAVSSKGIIGNNSLVFGSRYMHDLCPILLHARVGRPRGELCSQSLRHSIVDHVPICASDTLFHWVIILMLYDIRDRLPKALLKPHPTQYIAPQNRSSPLSTTERRTNRVRFISIHNLLNSNIRPRHANKRPSRQSRHAQPRHGPMPLQRRHTPLINPSII